MVNTVGAMKFEFIKDARILSDQAQKLERIFSPEMLPRYSNGERRNWGSSELWQLKRRAATSAMMSLVYLMVQLKVLILPRIVFKIGAYHTEEKTDIFNYYGLLRK